jgi:quinol monooxygenase YgiN
VRARGLSIYQMVFAGGQALAAVTWGALADGFGLVPVLTAAGVVMAVSTLTVLRWPLRDVAGLDREPAVYWPEPHLEVDPEPEDGPVLVTVTYTVGPENVEQFLRAMVPVRRMKLRTGATSYRIYRDGADPTRFVEVTEYPNWAEHLRQHGGRLTGSDRALEAEAQGWADGPPDVQHLLPAAASGWTR